jgi:hypothetical protein
MEDLRFRGIDLWTNRRNGGFEFRGIDPGQTVGMEDLRFNLIVIYFQLLMNVNNL